MSKYKTLKEQLIDERIKKSGVEGGLGDLFRAQDEMPDTETQGQYIGKNMVQDLIKPISEDKTEPKVIDKKETKDTSKKEINDLFKESKTATGSISDDKPIVDIYKALPASQEAKELEKQLKTTQDTLNKLDNPPITSQDARDKARADLNKVRQSRASTLEWAGLFERLVGSVAKYGAAKQGLDEGLDMSKVEIERTDWDKMIDRSFKEYEYELNQLTNKYGKEDKAKSDVDTKRTDMDKRLKSIRTGIGRAKDARAATNARLKQEHETRLARAKEKVAERDLKKTIADEKADITRTKVGSDSKDDQEALRAKGVLRHMIQNEFKADDVDAFILKNWDHFDTKDIELLKKTGFWTETYKQLPQAPKEVTKPKVVEYQGKTYSVDANGDMTEI